MNRVGKFLAIAVGVGVILTISSLAYSVRTHYDVPSNPPGVSTIFDWSNVGFPLSWITYCNGGCCNSSCSQAVNPATLDGLSAVADFASWFAISMAGLALINYLRMHHTVGQ